MGVFKIKQEGSLMYISSDPRMGEMKDWLKFVDTGNVKEAGGNLVENIAGKFGLGDLFSSGDGTTAAKPNTALWVAGGLAALVVVVLIVKK